MKDKTNELISDIYYRFNSACIIDFDALTIETAEQTIAFTSADDMRAFLLSEIRESLSCLS